jgi:hypothetical protein
VRLDWERAADLVACGPFEPHRQVLVSRSDFAHLLLPIRVLEGFGQQWSANFFNESRTLEANESRVESAASYASYWSQAACIHMS